MISEMEGVERKKGNNGVLVSLTVGFSSRYVCAGDHPEALQFHGQRQMSAAVASSRTAALHHCRLLL